MSGGGKERGKNTMPIVSLAVPAWIHKAATRETVQPSIADLFTLAQWNALADCQNAPFLILRLLRATIIAHCKSNEEVF